MGVERDIGGCGGGGVNANGRTEDNVASIEPLSQRAARLIERLKTARTRQREGLVLVEGVRAADTALDAGARVRFAVIAPRLLDRPEGARLEARLRGLGTDVRHVDDVAFSGLSDTDTHQGVLLVVEEPRVSLGDLRPGTWVVLDGVQDPGNAGTLVRAAAAFAADGLVALDGTVDLWTPKAVRASAGLAFAVPTVRTDVAALLDRVGTAGMALWVAEAGGIDVADVPRSGPGALVLGNEGRGPREELVSAATFLVSVPMAGPAESLNVGMAGSILLYALSRETLLG